MSIGKISLSFGKTPILQCRVKDMAERKRHNATLYKLNPKNTSDFKDVMYSGNTTCIQKDFKKAYLTDGRDYNDYYILQEDSSNEIISCAQVSHRYSARDQINPGYYTLISAMSENKKYINGAEPIMSFVTRIAAERDDKKVCAAYNIKDSSLWSEWRADEMHTIKNKDITDAGADGVYIQNKMFTPYLDRTERRNQIYYLV